MLSHALSLVTTAMDGGSASFAGATNRSTAMDGGSASFAGAANRPSPVLGQPLREAGQIEFLSFQNFSMW